MSGQRRPSPWILDNSAKPSDNCDQWADKLVELTPRLRLLGAGKCVFGKYHRLDMSVMAVGIALEKAIVQLTQAIEQAEQERENLHAHLANGSAVGPDWYIARSELKRLQAERRAARDSSSSST